MNKGTVKWFNAVVVNMVSDDFCSSRGSKEICMVMFVDSGKVVC